MSIINHPVSVSHGHVSYDHHSRVLDTRELVQEMLTFCYSPTLYGDSIPYIVCTLYRRVQCSLKKDLDVYCLMGMAAHEGKVWIVVTVHAVTDGKRNYIYTYWPVQNII